MTTPDMRDPTTASARIYIGNLDNGITRVDIENHFQKHGKILGVAQQNKFAFVQFPDEKNAMDAIQSEHQSLLNGRKIVVRTAADNNRNNNNNNRGKNRQQGNNNNNNNNNIRDRSPIDDKSEKTIVIGYSLSNKLMIFQFVETITMTVGEIIEMTTTLISMAVVEAVD